MHLSSAETIPGIPRTLDQIMPGDVPAPYVAATSHAIVLTHWSKEDLIGIVDL